MRHNLDTFKNMESVLATIDQDKRPEYAQLAKMTGLSKASLYKIFRQVGIDPKVGSLIKIFGALGYSFYVEIPGDGEDESPPVTRLDALEARLGALEAQIISPEQAGKRIRDIFDKLFGEKCEKRLSEIEKTLSLLATPDTILSKEIDRVLLAMEPELRKNKATLAKAEKKAFSLP